MFFGLGGLFYIIILLTNAVAVLSEDRFLAQIGLTTQADPGFGARDSGSAASKITNLVHSTRTVMRIPLILINSLIIVYELVLGGR